MKISGLIENIKILVIPTEVHGAHRGAGGQKKGWGRWNFSCFYFKALLADPFPGVVTESLVSTKLLNLLVLGLIRSIAWAAWADNIEHVRPGAKSTSALTLWPLTQNQMKPRGIIISYTFWGLENRPSTSTTTCGNTSKTISGFDKAAPINE